MTLTYLCGLMQMGRIRNALIVAPKSVQVSWVNDFYDFIGPLPGIAFQTVVTGTEKATLRDAIQWYVCVCVCVWCI